MRCFMPCVGTLRASAPIQLLEMDIFLGLLFVGEATARIQADKRNTSISAFETL